MYITTREMREGGIIWEVVFHTFFKLADLGKLAVLGLEIVEKGV